MAQTQHLIELNGQLYDTASGRPLDHPDAPRVAKTVKPSAQAARAIDGLSQPLPIPVQQASDAKPARRRTTAAAHPVHHNAKSAQKSKTLMRSAVKKPAASSYAARGNKHAIDKPGKVSAMRMTRAEKTSQSKHISRFGDPRQAVETQIAPLAVQAAPQIEQTELQHDTTAPVVNAHGHKKHHKGFNAEAALHHASSHKQPKVPKSRLSHRAASRLKGSNKVLKVSAAMASVLLLGGFFLYNNMPKISMRMAAARSGINASLPSYQPAGFGLSNDVAYSPGTVTVKYESNSDERSFALKQQNSALNSQQLLEEQVAVNNEPYQTLEEQGKTIYIKGNNAAWVDNGKLYKIEGNAALSSDQLLRVANSLR